MHNLSQPYDLGYRFYPPRHPHDPGYPRLDIHIRANPTELHFDPHQVDIPVVATRDLEKLTVYHPWSGAKNFQVYPGRVLIRDRQNKTAKAFTLGGQLEIQIEAEQTTCVIQSEAPILSLTVERSVAVLLVEEIEILLAERRAAWGNNLEGFEQRLATVQPLDLYHACLNTLRQRFHQFPTVADSLTQKFNHFLMVESQAIQDLHPISPQTDTIAELL